MTESTPPPPPPEQPAQPAAANPLPDSEANTWLIVAHVGIILTGFLAPLIVWLIGKDRSARVNTEGKEALNFGILISLTYIVGSILAVILVGFLLYLAALVVSLIFCIQAAMAASKGQSYRYPFNMRLVK